MTAMDLLRELEWCGLGYHCEKICWFCEGIRPTKVDASKAGKISVKSCGHKPGCKLAAVLHPPTPRRR
jgi:hypothetical protein